MTAQRRRGRGGQGGHEPPLRIRRREQTVVQLATEGRSQHEIARTVGITQSAVSQILRRVDERWLRENQDRVDRYKVGLLRKNEHLYREAMQSWERSKAQHTRRRQRQTNTPGAGETGAVAEVIVDDSHGDVRYLEAARRVLADNARLLGTTALAPVEAEANTPAVITLQIGDERTTPQFASRNAHTTDESAP